MIEERERTRRGDVLVIGGGIAGCFAAIKASENGADVILVDKGYAGKSGQSPYATSFMVFDPDKGHRIDDWMGYLNKTSEYLNNRYWTEVTITESYARYQDLISWGLQFSERGKTARASLAPPGLLEPQIFDSKSLSQILRKQLVKNGVQIVDRVMVTELLKQDGRIAGAVGISLDSYDLYTFNSKTTVLCVGACGFKPAGYPPLMQLTCDGESMAYRAGAEICGKEFVDTHSTRIDMPNAHGRMKVPPDLEALFGKEAGHELFGSRFNVHGNEIDIRPVEASQYIFTYLSLEIEAHEGRAPIRTEKDNEVVGGSTLGMSVRKADGLWPADEKGASNVPGLYAAGDSLGNMQNGAVYALVGSSSAGSAVTGAIAGTAAAEDARSIGRVAVGEQELDRAKQFVLAPARCRGGFSPRWVTQLLQNTMMPYFITYIKKGDRLKAALTIIEFMQEQLVPKLFARDPHELRLAHETKNMVLSAEMRLRSALFRTESRGTHYREDYPRRDDVNWLAWTKIREEQGKMRLVKVPLPKKWRPDLTLPYQERYFFRFPGE